MSEFVTGEAVRLDLSPAGLPTRLVSLSIDLIVQFALLFTLMIPILVVADNLDEAAATALDLVAVLSALLFWPVAFETISHGRSPGKFALGLCVVRDDGGPVRFRHSLARGLFMVLVDLWTTAGCVGLVTSLANARGKRVGDFFGGTVVVRARYPKTLRPQPAAVAMPPYLATWAAGLDLSGLDPAAIIAIRSLLIRAGQLSETSRGTATTELARSTIGRLATAPPPGTTPADFLRAVLAEWNRRRG